MEYRPLNKKWMTPVAAMRRLPAADRAGPEHARLRTVLMAAIGAVLAAGAAHAAAPTMATGGLVLDHVTVVDTATGALSPDMVVVIDGGKIGRIDHAGRIPVGGTARLIEARGKFVVPGFLDMHAHPLGSVDPQGSLTLMLANGITGVRQMSGSPELLARRRAGTLLPPGPMPEILAMPGEILTHTNAPTPAAAIAEVDRQKAEGTDFIKTVDLSRPASFAAADAAGRQGLLYEGHLSQGVDAAKASATGMRSIEHLGPPKDTVLVNCSTDEAALRQAIAHIPPRVVPNVPPTVLVRIGQIAIAEPALLWAKDPTAFPRLQHEIDTFSADKCRTLARMFAANHTWQVPTLVRLETIDFGDDPRFRNNPDLRYMPRATRQFWEDVAQRFSGAITPAAKATLRQSWELELKLVKLFDDNGVPMLAGSDFGGQWHVAGFDLHREFDLLAQAGLSPLKVLQMTTLNGAKFYGREASMGSVATGRNADLVLLAATPVESVAALHRIDAVIRGGVYLSRDDLAAMKTRTEQRMAAGAVAERARTEQTNAP